MESHYGHPGGGFRTGPLTGKTRRCGGCAVSCCCHISPALAADKVVQAGETVNDGTLTNHDNQIVFGTANGMTISTGLELGPDSEETPVGNGYRMAG